MTELKVRVIPRPATMVAAIRWVIAGADETLLCVAFVNRGGVSLLEGSLASRPRSRLVTTTVFGTTTADGLLRAGQLGAEVRALNPQGTFHPKLYLGHHGAEIRAVVGSANLTSGLLRNVEVGTLLVGPASHDVVAEAWEVGERLWQHPLAAVWSSDVVTLARAEQFEPDLWALLTDAIPIGTVVRTLRDARPNRIIEVLPHGLLVETERSRRRGTAEIVNAWMVNLGWARLQERGVVTNRELLDDFHVHRSSFVCALLAALPGMAGEGRPQVLVRRTPHGAALAAETSDPFTTE